MRACFLCQPPFMALERGGVDGHASSTRPISTRPRHSPIPRHRWTIPAWRLVALCRVARRIVPTRREDVMATNLNSALDLRATADALKRSAALVAVAQEHGAILRETKPGREYRGTCPVCGHGSKGPKHEDRFSIAHRPNGHWVYHCKAGCSLGQGGDVFELYKNFNHVTFPAAVRALADAHGVNLDAVPVGSAPATSAPQQTDHTQRQKAEKKARQRWQSLARQSERGIDYLRSRGIHTLDGSIRFGQRKFKDDSGSRWVALHGLWLPLRDPRRDADEEIVNLVTRCYANADQYDLPIPSPRGLYRCTTEGMFGQFRKLGETTGPVTVVEGDIDWLTARQCWTDRLVLGAHGANRFPWITKTIAPTLLEHDRELLLVPDNDAAGLKATQVAIRAAVKAGFPINRVLCAIPREEGADLNDVVTEYGDQFADHLLIKPAKDMVSASKSRKPRSTTARSSTTPQPGRLLAPSEEPLRLAEHFRDNRCRDAEGRLCMRRYRESFWQWQAGRYQLLENDAVRAKVYSLLDITDVTIASDDGPEQSPLRVDTRAVREVEAALPSRGLLVQGSAPQWLEENGPDPVDIAPVANGLLHLPTGELRPSTPNYFTFTASPVRYDPSAQCPVWNKFLAEIFRLNSESEPTPVVDWESIRTLRMYFGYLLSPDTRQQKLLFLYGPPRSGKGTIGRVMRALFGPENVAAPTLESLSGDHGLQNIAGKTVALITDMRVSRHKDSTRGLKTMLAIVGEDPTEVNPKNRAAFTAALATRIVIMANELPAFSDTANAFGARTIMLDMPRSFVGREDPGLTGRLLRELPGILAWAVQGARELRTRGHFDQPTTGEKHLGDLARMAAPLRCFIEERCRLEPDNWTANDAVWRAYKEWCDERRQRPIAYTRFFPSLKRLGLGLSIGRPRTHTGDRPRAVLGLALV